MKQGNRMPEIFIEDSATVAKALLGKVLCHKLSEGKIIKLRITETEAYYYEEDCCYKGIGKGVVLKSVGYLCDYYQMLLISCNNSEHSDNVLIRAGEFLESNGETVFCDKPIILRNRFLSQEHITAEDLTSSGKIWIDNLEDADCKCCCHRRVNTKDDRELRFCLQKK